MDEAFQKAIINLKRAIKSKESFEALYGIFLAIARMEAEELIAARQTIIVMKKLGGEEQDINLFVDIDKALVDRAYALYKTTCGKGAIFLKLVDHLGAAFTHDEMSKRN